MEGERFAEQKNLLRGCVLLNDLKEHQIQNLLELFHEETWPKNTCILNSEKLFFHFFIILSGRVKMYQVEKNGDKEVTLFLLTQNDAFDLFCLIDGCKHHVYYECLDEVKVLAAPMEKLRLWLNSHPVVYKNLLTYTGRHLRLLENFVTDISFKDIPTRLIKLLLRNINSTSNLHLINDLSNKEIAYLIGSTGAVINRHLQILKKNGSIKTSRNSLEVKDLKFLQHLLKP
ncbi:Crp/Fnr family transcriptional regulator [Antarcticibacterium flavum]|uniref:Crp/Fnr family transcriptional regulator n=1 Tax=Antarcticibacterium flavum TaxID=2058175 RepID=A0A5B7WZW5_9FLAO|nr:MULTISPECIES: Crp/Fnr family transcriptional regulator [Antarcticibacterium]MCM4160802.1 Crp/Fnr family transcriptional regulator [Antarcticibacterium sp. W02-3]QCY67972.1 Crp/Fnr family transcriptional regulator [Antarcticibacterium flavum]